MRRQSKLAAAAGLVMMLAVPCLAADEEPGEGAAARPVDPKWLDRLSPLDRALLDELIGYAPPPLPEDLKWVGANAMSWEKLRGRVVVVQSWTNKTSAGRTILAKMERLAGDFKAEDLQVILLHTPDGADAAERFLERRTTELPVVIDGRGAFCDALGVYKRPVNIMIGRQGAVRYAGINPRALEQAVKKLADEQFDRSVEVKPRPKEEEEEAGPAFPPITGPVRGARDLRGRPAPPFHVEDWVTPQPDARGRVVVVWFFDSDSEACLAAIPHLNELTTGFLEDAVIVGISEEPEREVRSAMRRAGAKFAAAVDFRQKMYEAAGVTAMPQCLVMSSDWVVRWQGIPSRLSVETMEQVIAANKAMLRPPKRKLNRHRWTRGR